MPAFDRHRPPRPASVRRETTESAGPGLIDAPTLMRIKGLHIRARVAVEGFVKGIHRSPYHGFSVEFTEYREYTPGDDPRYLDWRLFARSDRYYVKRFEDETNARCHILVDASRSMSYGSTGYTKGDYARTAAATLAYFLSSQRDAVGLATFEDRITDYLPPRHRPGQLRRLVAMLERGPQGRATDLSGPLEQIASTTRKRGLIVLVSDMLAPPEALRTGLGHIASRGHDVVALRIVDPAEARFDLEGAAMFRDLESDRELYIDPPLARSDYLRRYEAHSAEVERACVDRGVEYVAVTTDQPLDRVLFDLLRARMRLGRRPGRHAAPGRAWGARQ